MSGAKGSPRDDLRGKKKPFVQRARICLDDTIADEYDAAVDERDTLLDQQRSFDLVEREPPPDFARKVDDSKARVDAARELLEDNVEEFVFRSIGRPKLDELLSEHPPSKEQRDRNAGSNLPKPEFNPDTFPIALCAASCTSHAWSDDDWKQLWHDDDWNAAELSTLFNAAYTANTSYRLVDLGKGFAATRS